MDDGSVIPITSTIHAETFAQALGGKVTTDPSGAWAFFVGVAPQASPIVDLCKQRDIKTVAYWIGSDSYCALNNPEYRATLPRFDVHVCVSERLRNELMAWGVNAYVVWPCPRKVHEQVSIVTECVGCYQPTPGDNDIYMFNECVAIAKEMYGTSFLFYGSKYQDLPDNVLDAGRMSPGEVTDLYSKMSCVLRLTRHDGHPLGAIEAKMKGLHVVQNYPYPGFLFADNNVSVMTLLNDETTHSPDMSPWPEFYRKVCSPNYFRRQINRLL